MHEYAAKFADLLEQVATKIREMTVDRVRTGVTLTGLGIIAASLGLMTVVFVIWAIFGALEIPRGSSVRRRWAQRSRLLTSTCRR